MATLLSIQIGIPTVHGADHISKKSWESGIFKYPVEGKVWLDSFNLEGDGQQDLDNHGGEFRAVLAYGEPHYPVWRAELDREMPYGSFGENFTLSELTEYDVCLGDIYELGETRLQIAQPRQPCWKLARRNGLKDLTARVEARGWGGWYHKVLKTGYVQAGDTYKLVERTYPQYTIARLNDLLTKREVNGDAYTELAEIEVLSTDWRNIYLQWREDMD